MQYINTTIDGIDGTKADFSVYSIDNSKEIDPQRRRPTVLVIPGGGYVFTSDREAEPIALKILGAGYNAAILRYSCAPSVYPTALLEAAEAMKLLRENAEAWHIKPDAIVAAGFSAGGHLAGNLATTAGDETMRAHGYDPDAVRPNGLMLGYAVTTSGRYAHRDSFDKLLGPKGKNDEKLLEEVSIERHIDAKTPPTFIWHTVTDETVPVEGAEMTFDACVCAKVPVEAHFFPTGHHGLSLANADVAGADDPHGVDEGVQQWMPLFIAWLDRNFGDAR
ncbi:MULTISPECIES: alpha/beta hydrolase [unclassified Bifidobacterium]|uniref:alpha/beta hydrolase n=1 Tax=unclassified Bifidobacterium TaxID=2608897 RepID=UPI0023F93AB9|nr:MULTISPECIES: alpha/beta hydrolase [unclassified Bifidobacterium]WEV65707.1 alpha/beta hydrolase [Bifidobacterium sp. ESL0764]WEV75506.1 alpha/beta hydrolase [Bifidobacterium sp. ESL0800]